MRKLNLSKSGSFLEDIRRTCRGHMASFWRRSTELQKSFNHRGANKKKKGRFCKFCGTHFPPLLPSPLQQPPHLPSSSSSLKLNVYEGGNWRKKEDGKGRASQEEKMNHKLTALFCVSLQRLFFFGCFFLRHWMPPKITGVLSCWSYRDLIS